MSRHLFTSDLHFGHERVADLRGAACVADHDLDIYSTLRATVGPDDVLWVLGDVVGSGREWPYALDLLAGVRGRKRLILGNHDPAHPMNRSAWKHTPRLAQVFEWWGTAARTSIGGRDVMLSHFPYTRDRGEPRYTQWRLPNEGAWLLHGHTHGAERATVDAEDIYTLASAAPVRRIYTSREIHVGWDAWARPVADHVLADLMTEAER